MLRPAQFTPGRKYRTTDSGRGAESLSSLRRRAAIDGAGRHRGQAGHHTADVEDQHDVECRSVRRLVHGDIFTQYGRAPGPPRDGAASARYLTLYRRERWERRGQCR